MADGSRERNTIVSGERPSLTAGSSYASNYTSRQRQNDEHGHCDGCGFAASRCIEDRQERRSVKRVRYLFHVSPSKDQRDGHEETKESVDVRGVHDSSRNRSCRVFSLFRHVHLAVKSKQAQGKRENADHERDAIGSVSAIVRELEESVVCIVPWGQCPEDDDYNEQTGKMHQSQKAFDQRQASCNEDVDEDTEGDHCNREQGGVPAFPHIVRVLKSDESLYGGSYDRSDRGNCRLPASKSKPADNV